MVGGSTVNDPFERGGGYKICVGLPNLANAVMGMKQTSKTPDSKVTWHIHMLKV